MENEAAIPIVEEELHVGKREVDKGGVRVHTYIDAKPVQESVEVREENVYVERRPVDRTVDPSTVDAFQERTYEVRERAEQVVTEKQARVVEEVVVDAPGKVISLELTIDTGFAQVIEYFEIFLDRMVMVKQAAEFLGYHFRLAINGTTFS